MISRRKFLSGSSVCAGGFSIGSFSAFAQKSTIEAETQFGRVRGLQYGDVKVFKGIQYGADTSGTNRFKPPKNPDPWSGVKDAFEYGPAAPQSDPASGIQYDGNESEDCLVLNIWTRGSRDDMKRPVMFWCHGGGFRSLSGSSPRYDGTNLANRGDVVVVTINHRINMMGFTHFGDMGHEEFETSGTLGMQDIAHALTWVKNNIEHFGGDPNRVMIFGEAGGGRKVATLLGMPSAKGLFHAAVIESGATLKLPDREQATALASRVLDELNLDKHNLSKIQQIPVSQLMSAYHKVAADSVNVGGGSFSPTMDENVLPFHPFWPDASPVNPQIPVIVGANRTEMTYFASDADFGLSETDLRLRISGLVGEENLEPVLETYRDQNPGAGFSEIYFLIYSDIRYVMPSITIAERRSMLGSPTYLYYLTWETREKRRGAMSPHTLDIPFVFDNVREHPFTAGQDSAIVLADKISDSIIQFARKGDPNVGKLPKWETFEKQRRSTMVLRDESDLVGDPIGPQRKIMQPILDL